MKRIPPKRETAVPIRVAELLDRFEYPDRPSRVPFQLGKGGGGAPTIVIAASNSIDTEKGKADLVCTGVNDQDVIQQALLQLAQGGRLLLCAGLFNLAFNGSANCITDSGFSNVAIEGMGTGATILNVVDSFSGSEDARFAIDFSNSDMSATNLALVGGDGASGATNGLRLGDQNHATNLIVQVDGIGIRMENGEVFVSDCQIDTGQTGIQAWGNFAKIEACQIVAGGIGVAVPFTDGVFISDSYIEAGEEGIDIQQAVRVGVHNCVIESTEPGILVRGNSGTYHRFIGNTFDGSGPGIIFSGTAQSCVVANNTIGVGTAATDHGIALGANTDDIAVIGNVIDRPDGDGIDVNGDDHLVVGNKVIPASASGTAVGINILGGNNNAVYANYLGDASAYGTADFSDSGTGTITAPDANGQFTY